MIEICNLSLVVNFYVIVSMRGRHLIVTRLSYTALTREKSSFELLVVIDCCHD